MATAAGYGFLLPTDELGPLNPTAFIVAQMLSRARTLTLGVVKSLGDTGYINVQPLVSMTDGNGNAVDHGTLYNVPYLEMRAGTTAIVAVPVVGDIGLLAVCDRDISSAKASLSPGPPPSGREFDLSDAVYIMGLALGSAPTNTLTLSPTGFTFSGNLTIEGNLLLGGNIESALGGEYSGTITTSGDVVAGTVSLKNHLTSGVTTGSGTSGPPVP